MQKIEYIPIGLLHPHPDNPRKDLGDLTELAASIAAKGVLQNLTVVADKDGGYRIIIGHRRHAAAKLAGLMDLPCVVATMTPQEQFETMMVENVNRSDLTVYEQAEGFQMMLDMGGSVEEVAKKTGFSETTVRNRVNLLKLNKEKFRKAEERGGTLTDYLKLNAIRDPEARNRVLDAIGTAEFNYMLKSALDQQKFAEKFAEALQTLRSCDWCHERTEEDNIYWGNYVAYRYFNKVNQGPIVRPSDADTVPYVYFVEGTSCIYIYKKKADVEKKKTPLQEKQERYKMAAEEIAKQLTQLTKLHRDLREEFIKNFTTFNNCQLDIEAFAAKALMAYTYGSGDPELLGKVAGIAIDPKANIRTSELWNKMLFNQPLRALLCATYAKIEKVGNCYHTSKWQNEMSCSVPVHQKAELLDLLYEGLESLGYEMCEEEIQMQDGTHPLFKEAAALIAAFKEEK